jgi:putative tryptophan/tyrosine transport system substrate-binding protein
VRRRDFITLLSSAAATPMLWPLAARAQQQAVPVVGYLDVGAPEERASLAAAFRKGLSETGYVEGQNVTVEYHWLEGQNDDRLPALVADLVRRRVAVIATPASTLAAFAAKGATTTIPIVFGVGLDPVEIGLVGSLNRPAGNVTGVSRLTHEVATKRLALLHEMAPAVTSIAVLSNPANPASEAEAGELQVAARVLGLRLLVLNASSPSEIEAAFAILVQQRVGGLLVNSDNLFTNQREQIATLVARHVMPAIFSYREFPAAGGLMSYGASFVDSFRQVGVYAGRILKGEKPSDLPVQQATRVELVINLKTAKVLGLTVPPALLTSADKVIE